MTGGRDPSRLMPPFGAELKPPAQRRHRVLDAAHLSLCALLRAPVELPQTARSVGQSVGTGGAGGVAADGGGDAQDPSSLHGPHNVLKRVHPEDASAHWLASPPLRRSRKETSTGDSPTKGPAGRDLARRKLPKKSLELPINSLCRLPDGALENRTKAPSQVVPKTLPRVFPKAPVKVIPKVASEVLPKAPRAPPLKNAAFRDMLQDSGAWGEQQQTELRTAAFKGDSLREVKVVVTPTFLHGSRWSNVGRREHFSDFEIKMVEENRSLRNIKIAGQTMYVHPSRTASLKFVGKQAFRQGCLFGAELNLIARIKTESAALSATAAATALLRAWRRNAYPLFHFLLIPSEMFTKTLEGLAKSWMSPLEIKTLCHAVTINALPPATSALSGPPRRLLCEEVAAAETAVNEAEARFVLHQELQLRSLCYVCALRNFVTSRDGCDGGGGESLDPTAGNIVASGIPFGLSDVFYVPDPCVVGRLAFLCTFYYSVDAPNCTCCKLPRGPRMHEDRLTELGAQVHAQLTRALRRRGERGVLYYLSFLELQSVPPLSPEDALLRERWLALQRDGARLRRYKTLVLKNVGNDGMQVARYFISAVAMLVHIDVDITYDNCCRRGVADATNRESPPGYDGLGHVTGERSGMGRTGAAKIVLSFSSKTPSALAATMLWLARDIATHWRTYISRGAWIVRPTIWLGAWAQVLATTAQESKATGAATLKPDRDPPQAPTGAPPAAARNSATQIPRSHNQQSPKMVAANRAENTAASDCRASEQGAAEPSPGETAVRADREADCGDTAVRASEEADFGQRQIAKDCFAGKKTPKELRTTWVEQGFRMAWQVGLLAAIDHVANSQEESGAGVRTPADDRAARLPSSSKFRPARTVLRLARGAGDGSAEAGEGGL